MRKTERGKIMNKYESSGLESKHQQKYAANVQKNQKANKAKKSYNPLYPENDDVDGSANDKEIDALQDSPEPGQEENNDQEQQQYERDNPNK